MSETPDEASRLAELLGGLSLATDLVAGLPLETAMRTAVIASRLARELGLSVENRRAAYYASVLRFIGCSSFAPEMARIAGGDDMGLLAALTPSDPRKPMSVFGPTARRYGARALGRLLADPRGAEKLAVAHCELGARLASMLGISADVTRALGEAYERVDGSGFPRHLVGDAISAPARVLHVAYRCEVHRALVGADAALSALRDRRGYEVDPDYASALLAIGPDLLEALAKESAWEAFLAAEPAPATFVARTRLPEIARAFAHAVDAKSAFTLGHSTGVAALVEGAADGARLRGDDARDATCAALLHDLGRMAVPNGIWDKPGPLGPVERRRMESHTQQTELILSFSPLTRRLGSLASSAHERVDAGGYPRRVTPDASARLLAAADAYHAMTEERPHRAAMSASDAARTLVDEAKAGRFDRTTVDVLLSSAGHARKTRARGGWPCDLSDREVEVLVLLARGRTNKEIGKALFISEKTVQHHVTHLYAKTGISTRAAAAVFAVENALLDVVVARTK
jgi:HD-GYP domain-containing protein (c-di-GMP phosphodiesterase class II)